MPRRIVDLDDPDSFVVHASGEASDRGFFLQAVLGLRVATVALEREQLEMLLERMLMVIDELERRGLAAIDVAASPTSRSDLEHASSDRMHEDFHATLLTIAWDDDVDRLILEARSRLPDEGAGESASSTLEAVDDEIPDDAPIGPDVVRVRLRLVMVQRFIRQAGSEISRSRPSCPSCGEPMGPMGHRCPGGDGTA